jgi:hypothetical protein
LPNKWRHIGVVIADAGIYFDVIVGPVVARIAYASNAVSIESTSMQTTAESADSNESGDMDTGV